MDATPVCILRIRYTIIAGWWVNQPANSEGGWYSGSLAPVVIVVIARVSERTVVMNGTIRFSFKVAAVCSVASM